MQPIQYLYLGVAIGVLVTGIGAFIPFLHINNDWCERCNRINDSWYKRCNDLNEEWAEKYMGIVEYAKELENRLTDQMQSDEGDGTP